MFVDLIIHLQNVCLNIILFLLYELREKTGCIPGCVTPFGYSQDVTIIVDHSIYVYEKILITPRVPEFKIELYTEELKKVFSTCHNKVLEYKKES